MTVRDSVDRICEAARQFLSIDRIGKAKRRHADVFAWRRPDYLPILFNSELPELAELPEYNWKEQWEDPAKSFVMQMKGVLRQVADGTDFVPSVRADTGVINGPSLFGVGYRVPEHTKPVVDRYASKDDLADVDLPDDLSRLGVCPNIVEHMQSHKDALTAHGLLGLIGLHHCDTQGPFDIAAQSRGHDIFTDLYDDPDFTHHLMRQSVKAYVGLTRICRSISGETSSGASASGFWMDRGGVRLCDDSGILLSGSLFEEFVLPYHTAALDAFGGGWIHYCGGVPGGGRVEGIHLHDYYLKIPNLKGLNFTTGYDLEAEVRKLFANRVAYVGGFPREPGESLKSYFTRIITLCPERKGLLFTAELRGDESKTAVAIWHGLQDSLPGFAIDE